MRTDLDLAGTEVGELVGSTALVAVVGRREVHLAHCGDSRAVLCRRGAAIALTADHKPDRKDEAARVRALGGRVVFKAGAHRVMGLLAMSRALGDHLLRPYVSPDPEVTCFQRSLDDGLLLLATDGLWDSLAPQEAVNLALRSAHRARERGASRTAACRIASSVLTRAAVQRGSRDNITVVVVHLGSPDCPSLASVLAAQCSEEAAQCSGDAGGGGRGAGGGDTAAAAGLGFGGLASSISGAASWLSGLLFRSAHDPRCAGGGGGAAAGGCAAGAWAGAAGTGGGGCVFRASSAAARGARISLRRASTVTPVGVSLRPSKDDAGRADGSSGGAGGGGGGGGRLRRSLSFSAYELGHVLRRARIDA
ncbi:phosphatase 2C catalytic [Raphidocelis subcapitata]|uniref:Phosphatase 2C catalytic n=1 Tax=Raphidocelis subcapitata TaxID=307507 RepID=A0A2V0P8U3_9CHLO|nr:phosphatase 2C catalytic [Raphidocelis subcapitata]|eukprot:GBF93577.1 phosphatase 2C catalytic [Raphidocelis subcapitata]